MSINKYCKKRNQNQIQLSNDDNDDKIQSIYDNNNKNLNNNDHNDIDNDNDNSQNIPTKRRRHCDMMTMTIDKKFECEKQIIIDVDDVTSPDVREMAEYNYPRIQKPAPQFKGTAVVGGQFKDISLSDYKGKYVVLFFYPMDFTFVCPTEIIAFSERADEFRKTNCEVIACSTDSKFTHLAWINTPRKEGGLGEMHIPLLADKNAKISQDYGVYLEEGVPLRGLFIIDDKQILRQITINDLPVGRSVDETLRLVQAFQYTDVHGEVCPVNWKPGSDTIKPAPDKSKEYFNKNH